MIGLTAFLQQLLNIPQQRISKIPADRTKKELRFCLPPLRHLKIVGRVTIFTILSRFVSRGLRKLQHNLTCRFQPFKSVISCTYTPGGRSSPAEETEVRNMGLRLYRAKPTELDGWIQLAGEILEICQDGAEVPV